VLARSVCGSSGQAYQGSSHEISKIATRGRKVVRPLARTYIYGYGEAMSDTQMFFLLAFDE